MTRPHHSTVAGQKDMLRTATERTADVCRTFNEIQTGPNPITPVEIRALITKRPGVYGVMEAHASPRSL